MFSLRVQGQLTACLRADIWDQGPLNSGPEFELNTRQILQCTARELKFNLPHNFFVYIPVINLIEASPVVLEL